MKRITKCECITNYCAEGKVACKECQLRKICTTIGGEFKEYPDKINQAYSLLPSEYQVANNDIIDHPIYYHREDALECIDEMELIFGTEAVKYFCLCNAWKYRYRAADKNGENDLKKSDWYVRKYKELCNGTEDIW